MPNNYNLGLLQILCKRWFFVFSTYEPGTADTKLFCGEENY